MKKLYTIILSVAAFGVILLNSFRANAQYTKLLDFAGAANGSMPWYGSLISDGTFLYGMTQTGGSNDMGVVFKIKPDGTGYSKLLDFAGTSNGGNPNGSLFSDGTFLYGMTSGGGSNNMGVVFKIMPDGTGYSKLLDFAGAANGSTPNGSLISDGTFLYGMTFYGGSNDLGALFKIMPDGTGYSKLLDFAGPANGSTPNGSLISDGTLLYGMTQSGGLNNMGVIFKIMPDGTGYSKLLDFAGASNGRIPFSSLISDGTFLYGMTQGGGSNNMGIVFKIMPDGTGYSKLLDFAGTTNGKSPMGSLVSDGGAYLYGMTNSGGSNNMGVIFGVKTDGTGHYKLLDFAAATNGKYPMGSFIADGNFLYGMAQTGGLSDKGTVFKYQYTVVCGIETNITNLISIYPNPTSGKFTIELKESGQRRIEVLNMIGEKVCSMETNSGRINIDLSSEPDGVYFLKINAENGTISKKIIISK